MSHQNSMGKYVGNTVSLGKSFIYTTLIIQWYDMYNKYL